VTKRPFGFPKPEGSNDAVPAMPCVAVLVNLPKQVGTQARGSALPCGYRFPTW